MNDKEENPQVHSQQGLTTGQEEVIAPETYKSMSGGIKNYLPLILIVIGFILVKWQHLSLPHYWDEAWSYATAVHKMYNQGPTLIPGKVDVEATRGHPLFFYAAASSWMKVFGDSLFAKHSFALMVSILLLIAVYIACLKLYNLRVAVVATLIFASQIFFYVQSSMLLPEVMVTLFAFLSIYFFTTEKYLPLALALSLLVLTKESGMVLGLVLGLAFLIALFSYEYTTQQRARLFAALTFPGLIIAAFFIVQKSIYGWFFFPDHMGLVKLNATDFSGKFQSSFSLLFAGEKRKWFWGMMCGLILFYALQKKNYKWLIFLATVALTLAFVFFDLFKIPFISIGYTFLLFVVCMVFWYQAPRSQQQERFLIMGALFSIAYLVFCYLNFYTVRYLMPVLLFSLVAFAVTLDVIIRNIDYKLYWPVALVVVALSTQSYLKNNSTGDTGLGSYNALRMQQDVIQFLVDQQAQQNQIGTASFLQSTNLQHYACGFLQSKEQEFKHVRWEIDGNTDYALFDSIEPDSRYDAMKADTNFTLVFEVTRENVWGAVFKRNQMK